MGKFSKRLKALRKEKELKKRVLADLLHVSKHTYSEYESGESDPTQSKIEKLADYFSVTVDYLEGRTKDRQGTFSDKLARLERDTFYKTFGYVVDKVADAIKLSVKTGKKQVSVPPVVIELHSDSDIDESEELLKLELKKLHKNIEFEVKIRDKDAPPSLAEVTIQASWVTLNT